MVQPGEARYAVCVATNAEQGKVLLRQAALIVKRSRLLRVVAGAGDGGAN